MTSVLRVVGLQFHYLVYSSTEEGDLEVCEEPPLKIVRYANEFHRKNLPKSFCIILRKPAW